MAKAAKIVYINMCVQKCFDNELKLFKGVPAAIELELWLQK
jgi:hypothetical protein